MSGTNTNQHRRMWRRHRRSRVENEKKIMTARTKTKRMEKRDFVDVLKISPAVYPVYRKKFTTYKYISYRILIYDTKNYIFGTGQSTAVFYVRTDRLQ